MTNWLAILPFKSRKTAKADGDQYYMTGVPCSNGHMSQRNAENARCMQCQELKLFGTKPRATETVVVNGVRRYMPVRAVQPKVYDRKVQKEYWDKELGCKVTVYAPVEIDMRDVVRSLRSYPGPKME